MGRTARLALVGLALGGVALLALLLRPPDVPAQAPHQPIAFSHKQHAGDYKIDCQYCHSEARRSAYAGIPSVKRCMGCHQIVAAAKPEVQKIHQAAKDAKPIEWTRIHKVPGYVYFPHKRHVGAGLACQACHGQIQEMTEVSQVAPLTMGWCISCHTERKGPTDCVTCHH